MTGAHFHNRAVVETGAALSGWEERVVAFVCWGFFVVVVFPVTFCNSLRFTVEQSLLLKAD